MTTAQAAAALGVTVGRIRAMIASGRLPATKKYGRDWWIESADLEKVRDRKGGRPRKEAGDGR